MPENSRRNLEEALDALDKQFHSQTNEHQLKEFLGSELPKFRMLYRSDPRSFSDEIIDKLKAAQEVLDALPIFIEICEDIEDVTTREEAQDLIDRLHEIAIQFRDSAVRARIEKEYRGLKEKLPDLPSAGSDPYDLERNRRINHLNGEAPKCNKPNCGSPMAIRASKTNAWWGCSTFPKCYGRKTLTKKQRAYLERD